MTTTTSSPSHHGQSVPKDDVAFAPATRLMQDLDRGAFSSRELLELYLARIERHNPALNAVVTVDAETARSQADTADAARARGERLGPLHGLPITIKDCIETAGLRTTAGSQSLSNHVPDQDAAAVARLRAAGAIIFGKTNLPAFASDSQSFNDLFGTTNNPWDLTRSPGGSSGGSAAAIAAGLTGLEIGSDIGGSLRIPAHFCGIYTIKPTFGIVPLRGHIPPSPGALADTDVAAIGPLARSAEDLDLGLSLIAGPGAEAAVAWRLELPPPRATSLRDYRLAVWLNDPCCLIDQQMLEIYERLISELERAGAQIDRDTQPCSLSGALELAQRLIQGAMSPWVPADMYQSLLERSASASVDDDTPPVRFARNITQRARDMAVVHEQRLKLRAAWAEFFRSHDALLCPVTPTPAIPHDQNPDVDARTITVNGVPRAYGDQYAWLQSAGVVHLPAAVAPVGLTASGLPVGIQIIGPYLEDRTAIDLAGRIGEITGGFRRPPGY